ncbi:hypothetical protein Val02_31750 [Virgisporangium aliadipatigenens]|uniref:Uncharacterized protein n=1 Tax=Virgisporangium aliadipatigenens TaxID=741659 RepID=A0A8J3YJ32_9ACTN|nr:hypothetical protein [Virgisporangium aliadipatigenens]GIJ46289.1 hypothetical protein Val02_31750 [Virgisporangium aliadipatigenens]
MTQEQAPRTQDPGDPISGDPDRVASAEDKEPGGSADPNRKADTTREAAVEPPD